MSFIVIAVGLNTTPVRTVTVPDVLPGGTVTDDAGITLGFVDEIKQATPPVGAGPVKVAIAVTLVPPTTGEGEKDKEAATGASTFSGAVDDFPFAVAVIVAITFAVTATVPTLKVVELAFAGTVIVEGTLTDGLSDLRATIRPPLGAAVLNLRVAVTGLAPVTDELERFSVAG